MLQALELKGFKSFADETRLEFPLGVTVVVGPNGSGKSNIVDAVKWILGEQSVKSLRGKEMADVIFNGSSSRGPMQAAEASLILDNADGRLDVDSPTVRVTRRVLRSGDGEYLINKQACRLRDIRDLFAGTGVAANAYGVIEQGKVDVLLQSSPRERRLIFEEAAGISRFKAKKVETQRRLERVEQNLLRLSDVVAEVESRLKSVRNQAAKAQRHRELSDRLRELRTTAAVVDWRRLTCEIDDLHEQVTSQRAAAERQNVQAEAEDAASLGTRGSPGRRRSPPPFRRGRCGPQSRTDRRAASDRLGRAASGRRTCSSCFATTAADPARRQRRRRSSRSSSRGRSGPDRRRSRLGERSCGNGCRRPKGGDHAGELVRD